MRKQGSRTVCETTVSRYTRALVPSANRTNLPTLSRGQQTWPRAIIAMLLITQVATPRQAMPGDSGPRPARAPRSTLGSSELDSVLSD